MVLVIKVDISNLLLTLLIDEALGPGCTLESPKEL